MTSHRPVPSTSYVNHVAKRTSPCCVRLMPHPDSEFAGEFHQRPCTFTATLLPDCLDSAVFGSTSITEVSTASKLPPAIDFSSSNIVSGNRVSLTPWKYQLLPPSASTMPYFLNARSTTCVFALKDEISNDALRRKRAPIGGRVESVLLPEAWRAGHRYSCAPLLRPQMLFAVNRIACAISPA